MVQITEQIDLYKIAEIELTYKSKVKPSQRPQVMTSANAAKVLKENWNHDTIELFEEFKVLLLNRANKVLGIYQHSKGSSVGTIADLKLIFVAALKAGATAMILAHNHPSGNLKPSLADEGITQRFVQAGKILEIQINDHIIVTSESYLSFADEGLL